ncbi:hypothetical protein ACLKA6_002913 [Drosophila palustris]
MMMMLEETFANLWTRLRSPRPNRASGGYLLTGTSATREDELLGVTGRRTRLEVGAETDRDREAAGGWRNEATAAATTAGNECLINVTDFSDFQAAVTVTETENEEPITAVTELRVPSILTTTNISNSNNINSHSNSNNNTNNNNNNNNNNMSRILQPRYRFRDLLLGDFSFNDDGER